MKVFKFKYEDTAYSDTEVWPVSTKTTATHQFNDCTTWVPILYQFVKFLEGTGYVGVVDKIRIEDKYGMNKDMGFETFGEQEEFEFEWDDEEDAEELVDEDNDYNEEK
jgi:hypothetical protein